jgi:hypothetical protein
MNLPKHNLRGAPGKSINNFLNTVHRLHGQAENNPVKMSGQRSDCLDRSSDPFSLHRQSAYACSDSAPDHNLLRTNWLAGDYHGNHALCLEAFWLVTCQVAAKMWIQTFQTSLACRNNPSAKIVLSKIAKKQYLLRFFLEIFSYKTFVKIYFDTSWDFERDRFTEKWFLESWKVKGVIGCQRH